MLQRGLYHSVEQSRSTDEVMAIRKDFLSLQLRLREVSNSGEIRDLLDQGWKDLGLPFLKSEIDSALSLREAEMRSLDTIRATKVGWAIAIVFGFVAVPALADQVVMPVWKLLNVWTVSDPTSAKLIAAGASLILMSLVLVFVLSILTLFTRRRH